MLLMRQCVALLSCTARLFVLCASRNNNAIWHLAALGMIFDTSAELGSARVCLGLPVIGAASLWVLTGLFQGDFYVGGVRLTALRAEANIQGPWSAACYYLQLVFCRCSCCTTSAGLHAPPLSQNCCRRIQRSCRCIQRKEELMSSGLCKI